MKPTTYATEAANPEIDDPDSLRRHPNTSNRGWVGMPRGGWIIFGALAGAVLVAFAGVLAAPLLPQRGVVLFFWPIVGAAGLVGGLLGSRAPRMAPRARVTLGAIGGAVLLGTVGGFGYLFVDVTSRWDQSVR